MIFRVIAVLSTFARQRGVRRNRAYDQKFIPDVGLAVKGSSS